MGRAARDVKHGDPDPQGQWKSPTKEQFRELADVSALWFDGKWYLYPSVDMAWVSGDQGATWQHHPLNVRDIGYRVELETGKDQWTTILDRSRSEDDLLNDYRQCAPTSGNRVRLVILGWPEGLKPAVAEFTVFGKTLVP